MSVRGTITLAGISRAVAGLLRVGSCARDPSSCRLQVVITDNWKPRYEWQLGTVPYSDHRTVSTSSFVFSSLLRWFPGLLIGMDFLRNIASAALQSTGVSFPFTIGERIPGTEGKTIWDIREGVKKVSLGKFFRQRSDP